MIPNEPPSSRANHTHSLNHAIGRCPSSSVARGRPAVTCRDRRQSDTAVSQLIRPGLVHLLPPHCTIVDGDTTTHCLRLHTLRVIPEAPLANSHSKGATKAFTACHSDRHCLRPSPSPSLSLRFNHQCFALTVAKGQSSSNGRQVALSLYQQPSGNHQPVTQSPDHPGKHDARGSSICLLASRALTCLNSLRSTRIRISTRSNLSDKKRSLVQLTTKTKGK